VALPSAAHRRDIKIEVDGEARPYLDPPDPSPSPPAMLRETSPPLPGRARSATASTPMNGAASPTRRGGGHRRRGQLLGVRAHAELPGAADTPDNLQLLKGVGPKLAQKLADQGIIRFEQLAALSETEIAMLDDKLGPFKGRLTRDRVVEQASYLARGDTDGFEARFGKLGGA
jgi:predicted flap endonuclease-1-like 5' DNA nuclease